MSAADPYSIESLTHLLDALNCGAALIHRDGTLRHANSRLCLMLQRPRAQLTGAGLRELCRAASDDCRLDGAFGHFDEPFEGEGHLPLPDGRRLPVLISARPLDGPQLGDYRIVTIIDLSPQKAAEDGLRQQYQIITELSNTILEQAVELKRQTQTLEQRVLQRTAELHQANLDAIYMLAVASEAKDEDTGRHVRRIRRHAELLARRIGLGPQEAESVGLAAILHDVGKMHVPDSILKKPGRLTDEERRIMQTHTVAGERMLAARPFFERARRIARSHHENWDGSGYPDGLPSHRIPLEARIVHVVDVYDALISPRIYKPPLAGRPRHPGHSRGPRPNVRRRTGRGLRVAAPGRLPRLQRLILREPEHLDTCRLIVAQYNSGPCTPPKWLRA